MEGKRTPQASYIAGRKTGRKDIFCSGVWTYPLWKCCIFQLWNKSKAERNLWREHQSRIFDPDFISYCRSNYRKRKNADCIRWGAALRKSADFPQILLRGRAGLSYHRRRQLARRCGQQSQIFFSCRKSRYENALSYGYGGIYACSWRGRFGGTDKKMLWHRYTAAVCPTQCRNAAIPSISCCRRYAWVRDAICSNKGLYSCSQYAGYYTCKLSQWYEQV